MLVSDFSTPIDPDAREAELKQLTDPEEYRKRRQLSEAKAAEFSTEKWKELRKLCKTNLFFLCDTVLNYTKLSINLHADVCKWIEDTNQDRFRLLLLPRGHYKSTIYTIGHSIQAALTDDTNSNLWPYCLGTDIRICLMHEVSGVASKFLSEIQNHFLSNEMLMALFPECIPDPKKHTINLQQLQLPRNKFWKEKTFESMGVGGRSQGNHYNVLKPDDLMGKEAKDSKIILQSTKDWIDNLQSFLTSFEDPDHIDFTGTRWALDDIYSHIIKIYTEDILEKDQIKVYTRSVEEPVKDKANNVIYVRNEKNEVVLDQYKKPVVLKQSIFPEQYPAYRLTILKKNPEIFSAQYMNDPEGLGGELKWELLRYYYWKDTERFVAFDPRIEGQTTFSRRELDTIILIDPAMTGNLGIVVTGTDRFKRSFVLESEISKFSTKNFINRVFHLKMKWNARAMVVEKVNFSALYEYIFQEEMRKRGIRFNIIMHPVPLKKDKNKRIIDSLSSPLEDGVLYVNEVAHADLIKSFKNIGYTDNIHDIDALAMGPAYWRPFTVSYSGGENNYSTPVDRDGTTGYTPM